MGVKCCPVCRQVWKPTPESPVLARLEQIGDQWEPVRIGGKAPDYVFKLEKRYPGWKFRRHTRHSLFGPVYDIEARRR